MYKKIIISIAVALLAAGIASAQVPIKLPVRKAVPADSADVAYYGKKDFLQGATTLVGLNLGVWAFDRYVQKADFAKISWHTYVENLKHGFIWDNDRLGTNMFLHPYHGNLYFTCGRANGFNYWQSGLFAFAGSAMWELVMESEYPSTNDIIATPIGGMALGEVTYRASDIVLKDNTKGWERFGREAAAFIISPMRGLTRIINGDAWRYRPTSGRQFGIPNVSMEISAGVRWLQLQGVSDENSWGEITEVNIEYGDRYELRSSTPYDYFSFKMNIGVQKSQPILSRLNITGRLISRELLDTEDNDLSLGLYQHFDFYDSDTISSVSKKVPYKLGIPASMGFGLLYKGVNLGPWAVDAYTHGSAVLLGGVLSDHYNLKDRNYNLASGFSVKSGLDLVYKNDILSLSGSYEYYRLFTWGYPRHTDLSTADPRTLNAAGDESVAMFAIASFRADYRLSRHFYLTGKFSHYLRSTRYRDFPKVKSSSFDTSLMLTYKF